MKVNVEKQPKSQLKLSISVDKEDVKKMYDKVINQAIQDTEIPGFRKGKAPKDKVEDKIGVSSLYGNTINELLQKYYTQALKENHIIPISNPKVEIKEFDLEKDFEFDAIVAIKPDIKFKDYKKSLQDYYEKKNKEVKKENAEKLKKGEEIGHNHAHIHTNEIIEVLIQNSELDVPELLIEEETNRLVANLVDQIISAGMKTEDYLKAQNTDMDEVKKNYSKIAEMNIKSELILNELVNVEKISVEEEEIDSAINSIEDEKAKETLNTPVQRVYIRTVLEKNKLISNILKEIEGENHHE